jgi:tripartite-type tricarboxylate transporter receptor subunit TctC
LSPYKLAGRILLALALAATPLIAQAQSYPSKPVRFVVPYPPGGLADSFARILGGQLAERLGQPVVIDNKPGGSLIVGTELVAKSPGDGYTLLLGSASSLALNVSAFKKLPYDPLKDFAPVSLVFYTPLYLMVSPDVPAKSVKELIAYAKANPGKLSFASLGHGSSLHLAGEMFKSLAGIDILHVPYKGTTTALPDLMAGRVNMIFDGGAFLPQAKEGKVRMMAVTSTKRLDSQPDVPTMAEAGVPDFVSGTWSGIIAPAGTPKEIVDRVAAEAKKALTDPDLKKKLDDQGIVPMGTTPDEFRAFVTDEIARWKKVITDAGIKMEQ